MRLAGYTNLACGTLKVLAAAYVGNEAISGIRAMVASSSDSIGLPPVVGLILGVSAFVLAIGGLQQVVRGIGQVGTLVMPPRAPADLADYEADLAVPLMRRELPAFKLPSVDEYRLAHRLFPTQFPLLSRRVREQLILAVSSATSAALLSALVACFLWGLTFVQSEAVQALRPSFPWIVILGLFASSAVRLRFVQSHFQSSTPSLFREEFRFTAAGGGDPLQIPIGLEHELMSLRPFSGAPNRGRVFGFAMQPGGVGNTGEYSGDIVLETQPELVEPKLPMSPDIVLAVAAAMTLTALGLMLARPDYLADGSAFSNAPNMPGVAARFSARMFGAFFLLGSAKETIGQAEHFLSVFRFRSLGVVVSVQGTFGRAGVKVGKAIRDSIESENVIVRSDSAIVGYIARIESESSGLMGVRSVISMSADPLSELVRSTLEQWFEAFRARGSDIVGIDLRSEKVRDLVQANVAIDAQRTGAKETARIQASQRAGADSKLSKPLSEGVSRIEERNQEPPRMLHPPSAGRTDLPDEDSKVCPDCAERVRLAARRCRFCGYDFATD